MLEIDFHDTLRRFSNIVEAVEKFELLEEENISKIKAKVRLSDGSILWIREVLIKGKSEVYSYYWLRSDETVIIGWDNAPHHKEVETFPYHRHIGGKIESSQQMTMESVLSFITDFCR